MDDGDMDGKGGDGKGAEGKGTEGKGTDGRHFLARGQVATRLPAQDLERARRCEDVST